jgi:hypothetical protein
MIQNIKHGLKLRYVTSRFLWEKIVDFPESFFAYMEKNLPNPKDHKIYFDYGTETLDASYLKYEYRVDEVLQSKGYTTENYKNLKQFI